MNDGKRMALRHLMSPLVRTDEMEGRQYYVVPTVMMTEGVHNGIFYSAEELAKFPDSWNGEPVVVFHPEEDGVSVSANSPELIEKQTVGQIFNAVYDGGLGAEAWIDIEKCLKIAPEVLDLLKKDAHIDVSTGVYVEEKAGKGTWNDEAFTSSACNFRPDHLALLPGGKGACSWEDGAGLCRTLSLACNEAKDVREYTLEALEAAQGGKPYLNEHAALIAPPEGFERFRRQDNKFDQGVHAVWGIKDGKTTLQALRFNAMKYTEAQAREWVKEKGHTAPTFIPAVNEISHNTIDKQLSTVLRDRFATADNEYLYTEEVFDKMVVYTHEGGSEYKTYKIGYSIGANDTVELVGDPVEVQRVVSFEPVANRDTASVSSANTGHNAKRGGEDMNRKGKVEALIALGVESGFGKTDTEFLMGLEDEQFARLEASCVPAKAEPQTPLTLDEQLAADPTDNESEPVRIAREAFVKATAGDGGESEKPQTMEEYIQSAPEGIRETLIQAHANLQAERGELIEGLKANKQNQFTEDELKGKSLNELDKLVALAAGQVMEENKQTFAGRGARPSVNTDDNTPPAMPRLFEKKEE